jgi:quinol monooxygenase YgiN
MENSISPARLPNADGNHDDARLSKLFSGPTMIRRHALFAAAALCSALAPPHAALAQATPATPADGVTIVIPLNGVGASREASVKAMQAVQAVVRKLPGLIDEVLMENKNPANKPSHVHVMRWREQKNWEAVFTNPEFQKVFQASSAFLAVVDSAGIYTPVK